MLRSRLPEGCIFPNQWIKFEDANGPGYAQPDVYLVLRDKVVLFECKRTETLTAHSQLFGLYSPLLSFIYSRPITSVQVCRGLRSSIRYRTEVDSLEEAISSSSPKVLTWLWLP